MRTVPVALAAITLTVGLAAPALAHPTWVIEPPLEVDLAHGATDNVAFHARYPEHYGSAGGILTANDSYVDEAGEPIEFYVVTDGRGVFTYDISEPTLPVRLDMLVLNQATLGVDQNAQEDPSTDGRTLLVDGDPSDLGTGSSALHVISIEDPTDIRILGSVATTDHTWTCVTDVATGNGCAYAYGRSDNILDLRDPAAPVELDTGWKTAIGIMGTGNGGNDYTHDLTEVRPGLVWSAGAQPVLMDTTDPQNPTPLVQTTLFDHRSPNDDLYLVRRQWSTFGYHSVEWPNQGTDALVLLGTEIGSTGVDCTADEAVIETWDARPVRAALERYEALIAAGSDRDAARIEVFGANAEKVDFVRLDQYQAAERGIFLTGQALASEGYCAHWMEAERGWADGGRFVAGYYNRGVRFVEVTPAGTIDEDGNDRTGIMREVGWFTGADTDAGSGQWIDDEVVYVHDYRRGLDVLSISSGEATGTYTGTGSVSDRAMTIAELEANGLVPAPAPADGRAPWATLAVAGVLGAAGAGRRTATRRRTAA